jgi:cell division septation protein DedD
VTRDYKPAPEKQKTASKGGSFFSGLLIGLLIGVGASVGVAILVKGGDNPFISKETSMPSLIAGNATSSGVPPVAVGNAGTEAKAPAKPRFDFYTILPGTEKQVTEQEIKQSQTTKQDTNQATGENYFLQVGAFQTEQEADNLKARLALLGLEAVIQTANIPDKGIWHRVRVGPFNLLDDINRARTELAKNGIDSTLLKIHSNVSEQ